MSKVESKEGLEKVLSRIESKEGLEKELSRIESKGIREGTEQD